MTISGAVMQGGQALSPDGALYVKLDSGSAITGTTITATVAFNVGDNTVWLTKYAAKQLMISGDGTGAAGANIGLVLGTASNNIGAIWGSAVTGPLNSANAALTVDNSGNSGLNAPTSASIALSIAGTAKLTIPTTAGAGTSITAGTTTSNANRALSISQGWTDGTTGNIGIVGNFDRGATGTATGKVLALYAGAAGTTDVFSVDETGLVFADAYYTGAAATSATFSFGVGAAGMGVRSSWNLQWSNDATNGSATKDLNLSRISAGVIGVGTGAAGSTAGTLRAAALAANGSDFTITAANVVSPTSPNRTITISYGGTTYYLAAKTTND